MPGTALRAAAVSSGPYLDGGHADLPPDQHPVVLERGHARFLQLHEVCDQVGDVRLPVGAQQVAGLAPRAGALGHKLGEDPHGGVLVLQGTASAPALFLVFILALPCGPWGDEKLSGPGKVLGHSSPRPDGQEPAQPPRGNLQAGASGPHGSAVNRQHRGLDVFPRDIY